MSKYFDNKETFLGATTTQYGNHMVMTNVMKPGKTKYINIDTRFKDNYETDVLSKQTTSPMRYWFSIIINNPLIRSRIKY